MQRAQREEATQAANMVVPAEIKKREIETLAEAEAEGLRAILSRKAEGFDRIVAAAGGAPELASLVLVTEQLPQLIEEQVKAIPNLKIDSVTVWEGGRGDGAKTATADFLSGLIGSLPPRHELAKNVGMKLTEYLGRMEPTVSPDREAGNGEVHRSGTGDSGASEAAPEHRGVADERGEGE